MLEKQKINDIKALISEGNRTIGYEFMIMGCFFSPKSSPECDLSIPLPPMIAKHPGGPHEDALLTLSCTAHLISTQ